MKHYLRYYPLFHFFELLKVQGKGLLVETQYQQCYACNTSYPAVQSAVRLK
jgi:hypothetical protein